ncbi:uncharacterized protein LOC143296515 [Babylonia areolata]|uniref:uncharacterized protein LOC143296515 n=1 Tax=Babylonia areolata TaxID=304850 RepID=UPI003FD260C8
MNARHVVLPLAILISTVSLSFCSDHSHHHHDSNYNHSSSSIPSSEALRQGLHLSFQRMDQNGDGVLTYSDISETFRRTDTDDDDRIDYDEYKNYHEHDYEPEHIDESSLKLIFVMQDTRADTGRSDGYISRGDSFYFFTQLDLNGDNQATFAEYDQALGMMARHIADVLEQVQSSYKSDDSHTSEREWRT